MHLIRMFFRYRYGSLRNTKTFRVVSPSSEEMLDTPSPPPSPSSLYVSADGSLPNLKELLLSSDK